LNAWNNGAWSSSAASNFPEWVQVDFGANKTINEIHVFTLQDNWAGSIEPTTAMTFTLYGLTGYQVQYWNGSSWVTVPGGSVTGNNKIWKKFEFSPITTSKIRVLTEAAPDGISRVTEIEAYGPADTSGSGNGIHWLVSDHLGTPRIIFDQSGDLANVKRHDYAPFGEELITAGGRGFDPAYGGGDRVRQQFTSKERDIETGLDYFLARYYSPAQGRFMSPDEFSGGPTELFAEVAAHNPTFYGDLTSPQTLNKYQFTVNNPLRFIDPDGHQEVIADTLSRAAKDPVGTGRAAVGFVKDYWKGELKAIGNIGIGMNNLGAIALGRPEAIIEPFDPNGSDAEFTGYKAMSMLTLAAPAISKAGPAGVFTAEAKQTTAATGRLANTAAESGAVKTFQTYTKTNTTTGEVYAGRTSGTGTPRQNIAKRDSAHAYTKLGFGPAKLDKSSTSYAAIRGREQQLIDYFDKLGLSANKVNGVSPRNPNRQDYCQTCRVQFGTISK
jgi:RHS repeat-associated protein